MRRPLVAGNWKMNGSRASIEQLLNQLKDGLNSTCEALVFPPSIYVQYVRDLLEGSKLGWGVQDVAEKASGALTGAISVDMAADFGCGHVIIGHSERRTLFHESDQLVAEKFKAVLKAGLCPVLCVGETLEERQADATMAVVERQLAAVLDQQDVAELGDFVIAYEPVWAIGTGLTASPEQAQEVHAAIRQQLVGYSSVLADRTRILYGGSVKAASAVELFAQQDIDGGLVGGASLDADEFIAICRAAG